MELPKWAFRTESRVRPDGSIDMVFGLRPLGRLYLYARALWELARTTTITLTIEFSKERSRPAVTHGGEEIEPSIDYILEDSEVLEFVRHVPIPKIPLLIDCARDRQLFATTPDRRRA